MRRFLELEPNIDRINVTPIIDVALVLVIILLITAPLLSAPELEVELPEARTRGNEESKTITITMDAEGQIAIDDTTVMASQFESELRHRLAEPGLADALVIVRADRTLAHIDVRDVMERAKAIGASRIAIATSQKAAPDDL